jgi:hypothetical protein
MQRFFILDLKETINIDVADENGSKGGQVLEV